ncbi:tripartite motif-containing protein 2-like [Lingula anatina]|uniref:Tripartite motif-containing protein 2-like n=1 Tax=Lingula anatina TaxID=7574 RepID=A0A2R2MTA2_LINAN|nr:tripartite motif-containing protein 2-like [Lingula anatina]|eukprot:XP_023933474.1 tripartite motif-containing protein 2-like [Lingula anatina]
MRDQLRHVLDTAQYCDKHDGEPLAFYCENDDTVMCRECIVKVHSKHDFKELGDVVKVQRDLIQEKLKCLPTEKLSRFEKAENAIVRTEERLTENQRKVLCLVDCQKLAMTKEIKENSNTIERELDDYYQQVEKDVRQQTDAYLTSVKLHLKTYQTKVQSDYIEMQKVIDDKSNEITAEVMAFASTQVKTLESEKDKQEMNKIAIQSIRDFAQQLTDKGSDIEVMTHSKKLKTRIQELQTVEPVFDTKITDITFTPGQTEMDVVLQLPKIPKPQLSIKTLSITAKTYRGPLDTYFGSLKQKRANYPALKEFLRVTWLDKPERNVCFGVICLLRDIQCTDDGCMLVLHGDLSFAKTVSVFSSTGQCYREISIEEGAKWLLYILGAIVSITGVEIAVFFAVMG